jgi:hypothetical protein
MKRLGLHFQSTVDIPPIKYGNNQTIEKLINEETHLFAKFVRNEKQTWIPCVIFS